MLTDSFHLDVRVATVLARGGTVAGLLSIFGIFVFQVAVLPRTLARQPPETTLPIGRALRFWTWISLGFAMLGTTGWLFAQTAEMADAATAQAVVAALPKVVGQTEFGELIAAQLVILVVIAAAYGGAMPRAWRTKCCLALSAACLLLQAGHSHAASMSGGPSLLLMSDVVHLLAAGAWLGGLVPLLVTVRVSSAKVGAMAARWFSPMGKLCVVALASTALFQGWVLSGGGLPGLFGTAYGVTMLVKLGLFAVLVAFAVVNRYYLAPALLKRPAAKARLIGAIAAQTAFAVAIIAVAAILSGLPPAMHVQPLWPFPERFSMDAVNEAPEFRNEVIAAAGALAVAMALLILAIVGPGTRSVRIRMGSGVLAAGIAWAAMPHLDLLFVPSYPTSYYNSPTGFAARSIIRGAALYAPNCAACHGTEGRGDGPQAAALAVPSADLTAGHLWMHEDGELFWWLTAGITAPDGSLAMPGFPGLTEDDRWALIDFIRARNAGLAFHATGAWPAEARAPGLEAECADDSVLTLDDLRGGFVRVIIAGSDVAINADPGVAAILVDTRSTAKPAPGLCIARDEAAVTSYALIAGLPARQLPGTQFLIDTQGRLRAVQPPGAGPGWNDPERLNAAIRNLAAQPLAATTDQGPMPRMKM